MMEEFYYDETSPSFLRWAKKVSNKNPHDVAGSKNPLGYYSLSISGKKMSAHRVIYEMHHGSIPDGYEIDHADGNPSNNSISNLRLASVTENRQNARTRKDNATGIKGLSWYKLESCWKARIQADGKIYTRKSSDKEVCIQWLREKREELHGVFARHGEIE